MTRVGYSPSQCVVFTDPLPQYSLSEHMLRKKDPPYHLVEDAVDALLAHAEAVHDALPDDYHEEIGTEIMAD